MAPPPLVMAPPPSAPSSVDAAPLTTHGYGLLRVECHSVDPVARAHFSSESIAQLFRTWPPRFVIRAHQVSDELSVVLMEFPAESAPLDVVAVTDLLLDWLDSELSDLGL